MFRFISFLLLILTSTSYSQTIQLESFATGFTSPVDICNAGDDRIFIVQQNGQIKIVNQDGSVNPTPFLNINSLISTGSERGLLGLAFHPDYQTNGKFYVNYTRTDGSTVVSQYRASPPSSNVATTPAEATIIVIAQPYSNHNGGGIEFGPDGMLYVGMGDGGSAGDPGNRALDSLELLGKMLRLDVENAAGNYIPADNPFVNRPTSSVKHEIWALGVRNPWRFCFDPHTDDFWMADVGQNVLEEVNYLAANTPGGLNYGWKCWEASAPYAISNCAFPYSETVDPIHEYTHSGGACSVTGGEVYRGTAHKDMYGLYLYGDQCNGNLWKIEKDGTTFTNTDLGSLSVAYVSTFGRDKYNEVYAAAYVSGIIYRFKTAENIPNALLIPNNSDTSLCLDFGDQYTMSVHSGYDMNYYLLMDGAIIDSNTTGIFTIDSTSVDLGTSLIDTVSLSIVVQNNAMNRDTSESNLLIIENCTSSINDKINTLEFNIAPNPSNGKFQVYSNENFESIEIISLSGQKLFERNNIHSNTFDINLQSNAKGIYIVKLMEGNKIAYKKFVLK